MKKKITKKKKETVLQDIKIIIIFIAGCFLGYWFHPKPIWDIGQDKRGCEIKWDDGTYSVKSRKNFIGTLKSGESYVLDIDKEINNGIR